MKRFLISILLLGLLCGCNSTPKNLNDGASVEQVDNNNISTEDESKVSSAPSSEASTPQSSVNVSSAISSTQPTNQATWSNLSSKKLGWGQGYAVNDKNQPTGCIQYQQKYGHLGGVFIGSDEKNICLTFDEGYENGYTAQILDVLKEKGVKSVFFITYDYAKRNADLVKRMINEGHVVGNHTYNHPSLPTVSDERVISEIKRLHDYIKEQFGYEMTLFRAPMGEFSEKTLAITQSLGYKSIFWSFAYKDYDTNAQPEKQAAFERITKAAHNGGIFLLHAVSKTNTEILGDVIDNFKGQGYTLEIKGL
ncbi:MAG: polysaccharide deacetylase family protein [Clostridia bacterium]|nr:polysaccharide deacetylase family protein [Clostridia bacterium]